MNPSFPHPSTSILQPSPSEVISKSVPASTPRQDTGRAWIEINLSALRQNIGSVLKVLQPATELWAVVKANAYGHGAETVAHTALAAGASGLCVATLQEGIELRQAGLHCPVMLFGVPLSDTDVCTALAHQLEWTIAARQQLTLCQTVARQQQRSVPVHLNVDTGMSRLGVSWQDAVNLWRALTQADGLVPLSLYSHFATADELNHPATQQQAQRFSELLQALHQQHLSPPSVHLANSAATLAEQDWHYNRVRIGLALYGYTPANFLRDRCSLHPVMAVKARITHLKKVPAGTGVSYGHRYCSKRPQTLATVSIGYADGIPRRLSGQLQGWVNGYRVQQVGNVTMDQTVWMVPPDAGKAGAIAVGDVVDLFGEGWNAQHWADTLGTIPYEILCGFSTRLPRLTVD
ncbi:MAG: alanine racemase [Cyanobacteria bacterium P01_E01_bin.34]